MTPIYHITHFSNLSGMIADGGLFCDRSMRGKQCVRIGYQHIKDRRLNRSVPLQPGGCVGDYVPFSFAPRSPMLYVIHRGGVEGYTGGQTEVVHLVSSAEAAQSAALDCVFTDGHPEILYTGFYTNFKDLDKIDWDVMAARLWHDTNDDPDRKRRRQAEFLVHTFFPWELIAMIGVHGRTIESQVVEILQNAAHKPEVKVERNWYYEAVAHD